MSDIDTFDPQRVYDRTAALYASAARKYWPGAAEHLLDLADLAGVDFVLDVACGPGSITLRAARRIPRGWVVGVDISRGMLTEAQLEAARDQVRNVGFFPGDFHNLRFAPGTCDRVICGFAIFFARDYAAVVRNLWALVARGGILAISAFAEDNYTPLYPVYQQAVRTHSSVDLGPLLPAHPLFKRETLCAVLDDAGVPDAAVTYRPNRIPIAGPEDWWRIVHATGIDRIDSELTASEAQRVHREVETYIAGEAVTSVDLGVHYALARKAS